MKHVQERHLVELLTHDEKHLRTEKEIYYSNMLEKNYVNTNVF